MAGPAWCRLLADLGADVIKVEAPEGDHIRTRPPLRSGHSTYFGQLNCGKRSVALNLKQPESLSVVRRLVAESDVVVENFRPGVMARLGLDYGNLAKINPRLVYCSISEIGRASCRARVCQYV